MTNQWEQKVKRLASIASSLVLSIPLTASLPAWAQNDVIASAGQASVTQAEVAALVKSLSPDNRARLLADPGQLEQIVRGRLADKAILAEAQAKGWDKQAQVKAMLEQMQREAIVRGYLASVSAPAADYPSDAEIQTAYDQNPNMFTAPRALHLAQIYLAIPPNADAATLDRVRKQAMDLARQARVAGADFAALARANSQDQAMAANGGDMGYLPDVSLVPEVRQAADQLKPGEVSSPIQTAQGFHVIKLIDLRAAGRRPLAEVKEQIRAALRQQRAQQNAQAYMAKLAGPSAVTINQDALKKALAAAQ